MLELLGSSKLVDRGSGLKEVQLLLQPGSKSRAYLPKNTTAILQGLSSLLISECLLKAGLPSKRILDASACLKEIVKNTAPSQTPDKFISIIETITKTFPKTVIDDDSFKQLAGNYGKVLFEIFRHKKHLESYSQKHNHSGPRLLDFISETIESALVVPEDDDDEYVHRRHSQSTGVFKTFPHYLTDFLECMIYILELPIVFKEKYLQNAWVSINRYFYYSKERFNQMLALKASIMLFYHTLSIQSELCSVIAVRVYKYLPTMWETKTHALKELILVFLRVSLPLMLETALSFDSASERDQSLFYQSVTSLHQFMKEEHPLNICEIEIVSDDINKNSETSEWFKTDTFRLKSTANVLSWISSAAYYSVCYFYAIINKSKFCFNRKRPRLAASPFTPSSTFSSFSSNQIEQYEENDDDSDKTLDRHIIKILSSPLSSIDQCTHHVQFFLFYCNDTDIKETSCDLIFQSLCEWVYEDNLELSSWSLLGINLLLQRFPNHDFSSSLLDNLWGIVFQRLHTQEFGPVGCQFIKNVLSGKRYSPTQHKLHVEKVISTFNTTGPKLSSPTINLVYDVLIKMPTFSQVQSDARESLIFWAISQVINTSPGHIERFYHVSPLSAASVFLALCGIKLETPTELDKDPCYYGNIPAFQILFRNHLASEKYIYESWKKENQDKIVSSKPIPFAHFNEFELPLEEVTKILKHTKATAAVLQSKLKTPEIWKRFLATPLSLKHIIECYASFFLIVSRISDRYKDASGICDECVSLVITLVSELQMLLEGENLQQEHFSNILLGVDNFFQIFPYLSQERSHLNAYSSMLTKILKIFVKAIEKKQSTNHVDENDIDKRAENNNKFTDFELLGFKNFPTLSQIHHWHSNETNLEIHVFRIFTILKIKVKCIRPPGEPPGAVLDEINASMIASHDPLFIFHNLGILNCPIHNLSSENDHDLKQFLTILDFAYARLICKGSLFNAESTLILFFQVLERYISLWIVLELKKSPVYDIIDALFRLAKNVNGVQVQFAMLSFLASVIRHDHLFLLPKDGVNVISKFAEVFHSTRIAQFYGTSFLGDIFTAIPFYNHYEIYQQAIRPNFPKGRHDNLVFCIYTILQSSLHSSNILSLSLYDILSFGVFQTDNIANSAFPSVAIQKIAAKYNFPKPQNLFVKFSNAILFHWCFEYEKEKMTNGKYLTNEAIDESPRIFKFPFYMLGIKTLLDFLFICIDDSIIWTLKLYDDCKDRIESTVIAAGLDINKILVQKFSSLFVGSLLSSEEIPPKNSPFEVFNLWLPEYEVSNLVSSQALDIFLKTIQNIDVYGYDESQGIAPNYFFQTMLPVYGSVVPTPIAPLDAFYLCPEQFNFIIQNITGDSDIKCLIGEARIYSLLSRTLIDRIHNSINPVERLLNFRRLVFFICYSDVSFSSYLLKMTLGSIILFSNYFWDLPEMEKEIDVTIRYFLKCFNGVLTIDESCLYIPLLFKIVENIFILKTKNKLSYSEIFDRVSWLQQELIRLNKHAVLLDIILDWLLNKEVKDTMHFEYQFLLDPENTASAKKAFLQIISCQAEMQPSVTYLLLKDVDIKPVVNLLLDFIASGKASDQFIYWVARLIGDRCKKDGVKSMNTFFTEDPTDFAAVTLDDSFKFIFDMVQDRIHFDNLDIISKAEYCLRHLIYYQDVEKIISNYSALLDGSLDQKYFVIFSYLPRANSIPLPNYSLEKLKFFLETPSQWLISLQVILIEKMTKVIHGFVSLAPLITSDQKFCESIFPYLVSIYLSTIPDRELSDDLNQAFSEALTDPSTHVKIIDCITNAYLFLRKMQNYGQNGGTLHLSIDFTLMLQALIRAGLYEKAYMILELQWSADKFEDTYNYNYLIANQIYESINFLDMFYARQNSYNFWDTLKRFSHEKDYGKLLQFQSAAMSAGYDQSSSPLIPETLQKYGLEGVSKLLSNNTVFENDAEVYSYAWKLDQWDLPEVSTPKSRGEIMYNIMKKLHDDYQNCFQTLDDARKSTISLIYDRNQTKEVLQTLQIIEECNEIYCARIPTSIEQASKNLLTLNLGLDSTHDSSFEEVEDLLLARNLSWKFKDIFTQNCYRNLGGFMADGLYNSDNGFEPCALAFSISQYCEVALEKKALQKAINGSSELDYLYDRFKHLKNSDNAQKIMLISQMEKAKVMWQVGEKSYAINLLRGLEAFTLLPFLEQEWKLMIRSKLIEWFNDSGFDLSSKVTDLYLRPAIGDIQKLALDSRIKAGILHTLAEFCNKQYQDKEKWDRLDLLEKQIDVKDNQVRSLKRQKLETNESITLNRYQKIIVNDKQESEEIKNYIQYYLESSGSLYLLAAITDGRNGEDVAKFMSIWFGDIENEGLNKVLTQQANFLAPILFVPWVNQLTSRLDSNTSEPYQMNVRMIVQSLCEYHPYHIVYPLRSLSVDFGKTRLSPGMSPEEVSRVAAGQELWNLMISNARVGSLFANVDKFILNAIHVATVKPGKLNQCSLNSLSKSKFWWKRELGKLNIPSPTLHITPRVDCNYSREPALPLMTSADDAVVLASGLSRPKIIKLYLSNGQISKILLKGGNDDMRQDSIMEQVFEQINTLFKKYEETRKRNLSIRTYKVIPLGKSAGIIEFVENTVASTDFLSNAHRRYWPKDISERDARSAIAEAVSGTRENRIRVYREVVARIHPVMHMFFLERFFSCDKWFSSKTNYIRSTASNSILGHVLGIGDRHMGNILLDTLTGDVVHIDLGIAFDAVSDLVCFFFCLICFIFTNVF